jgi:zinc-binding alcohol dehydrogenase family protein
MRAVGYYQPLPIDHPEALVDLGLAAPTPAGRDLLVSVRAVSVNPVDTKVRKSAVPPPGSARVLGFDAAGIVDAVGPEVTHFRPGDRVFYAGAIDRPGSNAELQLVDERIVGPMPKSLSFADAAALPLTALTAWELLFERLGVVPQTGSGEVLLIVGGAGGVGSTLIQLARQLTALTVIATASRPETRAWCLELGAHQVIDHAGSRPLDEELAAAGVPSARYIASLTGTDGHFAALTRALAPQGRLGIIDDPGPIDVRQLKRKSASLHWELMFTRSLYQTSDLIAQQQILSEVARLVDEKILRSTASERAGSICAADLRKAHALIESGRARGKIVLEGFGAP